MRWHVAVLQSWSQRSQRAWSKHPPAVDFIAHSSTTAKPSPSSFPLAFFSGHLLPSAAVCRADPRRHYPLPSSKSEGAAFFLSGPHGPYFLFGEAGEVPAVPEQQLRLPHRSRRQNEVPVVRWRGLSTYPNRYGTCLSVTPYGRHARCGSLWCSFSAVASPSWSTEF